MKSVLFKHRSIRKFRPTPIPEEVLRECFNQPMVRQAPCVVTVCADIHRFTMWCEQRDADPAYDNFAWFLNASTDALLAAADERTRLLWLCSPNNPTGNAFPAAGIERLLREFDGMVVLDEAYIDFAAGPGFLARLGEFGNLIVLQTLSKAWGMAGLRLGLAFASEAVAGLFARVKYPYNINSLAQQAVAERLTEDIAPQVAEIRAERDRLAPQLAACPAIERVYPSDANFILVRTPDPDRMYDALISAGVIVRNRSRIPGCEGCLRITVGTPAENARMIETVKNFRL